MSYNIITFIIIIIQEAKHQIYWNNEGELTLLRMIYGYSKAPDRSQVILAIDHL